MKSCFSLFLSKLLTEVEVCLCSLTLEEGDRSSKPVAVLGRCERVGLVFIVRVCSMRTSPSSIATYTKPRLVWMWRARNDRSRLSSCVMALMLSQ